jgi:hypothetical protein
MKFLREFILSKPQYKHIDKTPPRKDKTHEGEGESSSNTQQLDNTSINQEFIDAIKNLK